MVQDIAYTCIAQVSPMYGFYEMGIYCMVTVLK